jgi:transcriptional regulator with XRE-family HTH domain
MKSKLNQPAELERAQFAQRVNTALAARDMPLSATALQRAFNERYPELAISVHAARKWIAGESIPTQARLRAVADVLQVSATWLRFGEELATSKNKSLSVQEHMLVQQFRRLSDTQRTHVLALVQSAVDLGRNR